MHGDGEFDDPEIRAEVAAGRGDALDEESADLGGERCEFVRGKRAKVGRGVHTFECTHGLEVILHFRSSRVVADGVRVYVGGARRAYQERPDRIATASR